MTLEDTLGAVDDIGGLDDTRRATFETELAAFEAGSGHGFERTRERIDAERAALERLAALLSDERARIEELADHADFLTVEQAVEHRDETIRKLDAHNRQLRAYHDALVEALDIVEGNLTTVESKGLEAVVDDPEPYFESARAAIEAHNDAVDGLDTNMTILNAYLS